MKKTILTFISLIFLINLFGQKTEFRISFNSGLFSFSGQSAEKYSQINYNSPTNTGYTNNPYGSGAGLGYGLSGNLQRVTKNNLVFGIDLGYEFLRSKVEINAINVSSRLPVNVIAATGQTFLNYNFINIFPFIGQKFKTGNLYIEIIGGLDIANCISAKEKGNATATNETKYATSVDRKTIKTDIRPRIQLSAEFQKVGIYLGYSYGLVNYKSGYVGGVNECYARLVRFGITYRIK